MSFLLLICYLALGIVSGVFGGVFGIGGGIIIVPALVLLFKLNQKEAQGTSLAALLLPVGLLGAVEYYKAGQMNLVGGLLIAGGFFVGAFFGSKLSLSLDEMLLRRLFAGLLVALALQLLLTKSS